MLANKLLQRSKKLTIECWEEKVLRRNLVGKNLELFLSKAKLQLKLSETSLAVQANIFYLKDPMFQLN